MKNAGGPKINEGKAGKMCAEPASSDGISRDKAGSGEYSKQGGSAGEKKKLEQGVTTG